ATTTPTATPCPTLTELTLRAQPSFDAVSAPAAQFPVRLSWTAQGGCDPFKGTIVGKYSDQSLEFATYPVSQRTGQLDTSAPVRTCTTRTTLIIVYDMQLTDGRGQTVRARTTIQVDCRVQATPTSTPEASAAISVGKGTYEVGEVMRVCYRVSTGGTIQLSDLLSDGSARVIHARTA